MKQQGGTVHHSSIFRWVQRYGPEWAARCRPFLKPTNRSYRVDETYIKVKGKDRYLYRAVDSTGQTVDFLLTAKRDKASAQRFFRRALRDSANVMPRVINVDKNAAYPVAVQELKAERVLSRRCRLRRCKVLNNIVEQDHRTIKRRMKLAMGYGSFRTAWRTIQGIETMHLIRQGRVRRVPKNDALAQQHFIHKLFEVNNQYNKFEKVLALEFLQHCLVSCGAPVAGSADASFPPDCLNNGFDDERLVGEPLSSRLHSGEVYP